MKQTTTFKPRIRRLSTTRFLVESTSRPGLGHQVDVLHLRCSCEAGQHGMRCRHLLLALQLEDYRKREMAKSVATARPRGMAALAEAFA